MLREITRGAAAGAVGTAVLNLSTYGDMLLRGRPASKMPVKTAKKMAQKADVSLRREGEAEEKKDNRVQALGALMGYVAGIGVGVGYGLLRSGMAKKSTTVSGVLAGTTAAVAGAAPQVALGLTNPKDWGVEGWAADLVPHMLYGLSMVATFEAMNKEEGEVQINEVVSVRR